MPEVPKGSEENCLAEGALGIGEDHDKPDGREEAIRLIETGCVKHLFVEFAETMYPNALANAKAEVKAGKGIEDVALSLPVGINEGCPLKLRVVIAKALMKGVPVYFADHIKMNHPLQAGSANTFKIRHGQIQNTFLSATNAPVANAKLPEAVGCLFLWGGNHFDTKNGQPLDKYIVDLPYVIYG